MNEGVQIVWEWLKEWLEINFLAWIILRRGLLRCRTGPGTPTNQYSYFTNDFHPFSCYDTMPPRWIASAL